ncbi:sortase [Amycolatopsis sp. CA-230715]|uniref:sortase n=1 Tax=Amycolatopsis sp. CA-230715 TaxID=2745196 RepID=UPI0020B40F86|nr:class E sortase [Amycolatopsis sp. CA-230715]
MWITGVVVGWVLTSLLCFAVVVYALGPMIQNSDQRAALTDIRGQIDRALGETQSLLGATTPKKPAEFGTPVAVVEFPTLALHQVVLEGVAPGQTASGPGHVPGTSGLGQPGNSAVVGRFSGYGGPFARLAELRPGNEIVVATTQGKSVYRVTETAERPLDESKDYGKTGDDRLTLVTSTSWWPLASETATVVTAVLDGKPFSPTPQNGKADAQDGRTGDTSAWPTLVLALGGFAAVAVGATWLYRRWRPVSNYVLTAPAMLTLATLAAMALWRLLPAWA